jgi:hypothetical protein
MSVLQMMRKERMHLKQSDIVGQRTDVGGI